MTLKRTSYFRKWMYGFLVVLESYTKPEDHRPQGQSKSNCYPVTQKCVCVFFCPSLTSVFAHECFIFCICAKLRFPFGSRWYHEPPGNLICSDFYRMVFLYPAPPTPVLNTMSDFHFSKGKRKPNCQCQTPSSFH